MSICMKIPKLPKCCCCIELRTGAIILSALSVVGSVILLLSSVGTLVALSVMDENSRDEFLKDKPFSIPGLAALTGVFCFGVTLSIFLLIGLVKRRLSWLKVGLWLTAIIAIVQVLIAVVQIFFDPFGGISTLIVYVIQAYFWLCIQSYYQEMVNEKEQQQQQLPKSEN